MHDRNVQIDDHRLNEEVKASSVKWFRIKKYLLRGDGKVQLIDISLVNCRIKLNIWKNPKRSPCYTYPNIFSSFVVIVIGLFLISCDREVWAPPIAITLVIWNHWISVISTGFIITSPCETFLDAFCFSLVGGLISIFTRQTFLK